MAGNKSAAALVSSARLGPSASGPLSPPELWHRPNRNRTIRTVARVSWPLVRQLVRMRSLQVSLSRSRSRQLFPLRPNGNFVTRLGFVGANCSGLDFFSGLSRFKTTVIRSLYMPCSIWIGAC